MDRLRNNIAEKLRTNKEFLRILLAELLGTLFLVVSVVIADVDQDPKPYEQINHYVGKHPALGDGAVAQFVLANKSEMSTFLTVNLAFALAIAFGVYICGGVSGGHINPAVTLAMCIFGRCDWVKLPAYFIGQCLGGFLGSMVIYSAYYDLISHYQTDIAGLKINDTWSIKTAGIFATMPNDNVGLVGCYYDQIVGTAILLIIVFAVTDPKNMQVPKHLVPLLVGLGVGVIGMAYGINCGYAINPARDLAPRLFTLLFGWGTEPFSIRGHGFFMAPVISPFIGAILGALIYQAFVGIHWPPNNYQPVRTDEIQGRIVETVIIDPKGRTMS